VVEFRRGRPRPRPGKGSPASEGSISGVAWPREAAGERRTAAGDDGRREPGGGAVAAWLRAGEARVVQGQGLEASLGCVSALEEHVDDDGVPGRAARAS
jgi:hypothetical protein